MESNDAQEEMERFCSDLRRLQSRSKCTNALCADIVSTFARYLKVSPTDFRATFRAHDKKMQQEAGVSFLRLNGCPKCHKFVYLPDDPRSNCPYVKADGSVCEHPRFDADGKPFEVCKFIIVFSMWRVVLIFTYES